MKYYLYFVVLLTKLCSFPLSCVLLVRKVKLHKVTTSQMKLDSLYEKQINKEGKFLRNCGAALEGEYSR